MSCSEKKLFVAHDLDAARPFAERLTLISQTFTATMFLDDNCNAGYSPVDSQKIKCGCEPCCTVNFRCSPNQTSVRVGVKFKPEVEFSHENGPMGQQLSYQCLEIGISRNSTKGLLQGDMCRLVV